MHFDLTALIYILIAGLLSLIAPLATFVKIVFTLIKRGPDILEGPDLPTDEGLPAIRGPLVTADELDIIAVGADEEHANCPICATALAGEDIVTCPKCQTKHHQDCWEFNDNSCAVYGCVMTTEVPQTTVEPKKVSAMTPFAEQQFNGVKRRFRRWFWSYRLQWWSTVSFCFFAASGCFISTLGIMPRGIASLFSAAALYALAAAVFFFIFARLFRYILEGSCERLPAVPPDRMATLLDKIEKSQSRPQLERAVEWSPYIFTLMAAVPLSRFILPGSGGIISGTLYTTFSFLFGGFFVWMALISTRRHRATLERIRSRLRGASKV